MKQLTDSMITALRNLSDGETKHGAYAIPGSSGRSRNAPLRVLKERGLIAQIRDPHGTGDSKRVYWVITDAGRAALAESDK